MRYKISIGLILASILVLMFVAVGAQQGQRGGSGDRDQQMDRDRTYERDYTYDRTQDRGRDRVGLHDQDRDRDRLHLTDPASLRDEDIYGSALMSEAELQQYRNQLMNMETYQAREQYQVQHEEMLQERAQRLGKDLVPPGQGPVYGGELMTVQERNQYREQLRNMDSEEEREKLRAQHREQMQLRAKALELDIEEAE
jgi:GTPase involved in cell partitioning and DNA repair